MRLAPAAQSAPPQSQQSLSDHRKAVEVAWYRVVVEVTLHDRLEPSSRLSYGIMHAPMELLLKLPQFRPHALADCFALQSKTPIPVFSADMGKSQKVERFRFSFSSLSPVLFGKAPELDPARLFWVQFQPKLSQPLPKCIQETIRVCPELKTEYIVVRIADDNHFPLRTFLAPGIHPQVEHVVHKDVGQQR